MGSVEINWSAKCLECNHNWSRFKANQQAKHQAHMPASTKSKQNQMKTPRMIPEARTWLFILSSYTEYQKASKEIMVPKVQTTWRAEGKRKLGNWKPPDPRVEFLKDSSSSSPRASFHDNLDRTKIIKLCPPIMTAEVLGPVAPWVSSHSLLQLLQISVACLPTSIPLPWLERNGNI